MINIVYEMMNMRKVNDYMKENDIDLTYENFINAYCVYFCDSDSEMAKAFDILTGEEGYIYLYDGTCKSYSDVRYIIKKFLCMTDEEVEEVVEDMEFTIDYLKVKFIKAYKDALGLYIIKLGFNDSSGLDEIEFSFCDKTEAVNLCRDVLNKSINLVKKDVCIL